jgi:tRNA uridine 5-carbamoylmethylation protein Kti12
MEEQQIYNTNNYFLTLCGIPGSGKTTLSNQLVKRHNIKLYCYDTIIHNNSEKPENVRAWILTSIKNDLQAGYNVILDDSNILAKSRTEVLEAIEGCKSQKILIVMNTPLDICLLRNTNRKQRLPDWVINHMHRKYQSPTIDEGWDKILYY